ncbi:MAG: dicarboxylate/amino acid:cation symporter [Leptolyngbyaceae cyanobacterium bins.349]|nr:dicarboxylate/amino acid:cation symporter [Leptolyngbyaceae cyanobacterium bins.349]
MEAVTKPRSLSLSSLILIFLSLGIGFGVVLNLYFPEFVPPLDRYVLSPIGKAFLRLIQFVVVPIVFSSLVLGLTGIRDANQAGRYVIKLLICYVLTSSVGVLLGMTTALLLQPGSGIEGLAIANGSMPHQSQPILDWLISLIPINPLEALSTSNLLQTIFSAALLVVGIQRAGEKATPFVALMESIYVISEKVLSVILYLAPVGVFALISSVIATQGFKLVSNLLLYVLGLWIATTIMISLYVVALFILQGKPLHFLKCFTPSLSLGFGTASSIAALPLVLQNGREYGLREEIADFAIPIGAAIKRDGSAILQGFNALFVAQIFHVPITTELLVAIATSTLLVSFSTPGVPGSALITMTTVLTTAGLPLEGVAIVAGVDRLTDGIKTVLNIIGNVSNALLLSRWEQVEVSPQLADEPEMNKSV